MADVTYNTMRFLTDTFDPYNRKALLVAQEPLALPDFSVIEQITVLGDEPTGTKRRFLLKADNLVYKLRGSNFVPYYGAITIDNVLDDGNSAEQLNSVSNNTDLAGKKIYPIIALSSTNENTPTAKISITTPSHPDVLEKVETGHWTFVDNDLNVIEGTILDIPYDAEITGDAFVKILVRIKNTGDWTDYMPLENAKGQNARQVEFQATCHVAAANGTNSAAFKNLKVLYSPDVDFKVYGDEAYIYSKMKYCIRNLSGAVLVVRHEALDGASIDADVSYQVTRVRATNEFIGLISSQGGDTLHIHYDIFPWDLKIYLDGVETTDYEFNTADNSIYFPNPLAESRYAMYVTADFTYNRTEENWLPMTRDKFQPTGNDLYTTRFALPNPDFDTKELTTGVIRIKLNRGHGTITLKERASAHVSHTIRFARTPVDIECDADEFSFDYETGIFTFETNVNRDVNISYTWQSASPVVHGWSIVYSA